VSAVEEFIGYFESCEGIQKVMELTDAQFEEAWAIESRVETQTHSEYENVGFEEVSKREKKVCIFMDDRFVLKKHSLLKMLDRSGRVIGTSVPEEELDSYRQRDDVIWISSDFVMFLTAESAGQERFVLYPYEFPELSDTIKGCANAVGTSPATPTDARLKGLAGMPLNTRLFTFIFGFDCQ
jgi:hypothetical protein